MSRRHQLPPLLCLLWLLQILRHISAEERSTCIACSKSPDWDNNKTCRTQKRTLQAIGAGNEAIVLQFNEGKVADGQAVTSFLHGVYDVDGVWLPP